MAADMIARGIGLAEVARQKRLRILNTLRTSIERTGFRLPQLDTALPTIGLATAATAIATGTSWQVSVSGTPALHAAKYTFLGGTWANNSAVFPDTDAYRPFTYHAGNGTDPTTNFVQGVGRVRFSTAAPKLELWVKEGATGGGHGFRMQVDGKLSKAGLIGLGSSSFRYIPVTWGDGTATFRKNRNYELEFGPVGQFCGIRTEPIYSPEPWPQADGLRVVVHGDSLLQTIVDTGSLDTPTWGAMGAVIGNLIGQADTWVSGVGGTGWFNSAVNTKSTFNQRVTLDVVAPTPDVVIEMGGGNDFALATQSQLQAAVESWLATVVGANPNIIIFMIGPVTCAAWSAANNWARDAKKAAAAKYPRNVAFIDSPVEGWTFGTGKQGTVNTSGNTDWVLGSDAAHPTIEGHVHLAGRIAKAVAKAIPGLIAAQ